MPSLQFSHVQFSLFLTQSAIFIRCLKIYFLFTQQKLFIVKNISTQTALSYVIYLILYYIFKCLRFYDNSSGVNWISFCILLSTMLRITKSNTVENICFELKNNALNLKLPGPKVPPTTQSFDSFICTRSLSNFYCVVSNVRIAIICKSLQRAIFFSSSTLSRNLFYSNFFALPHLKKPFILIYF